nr:serine/threonine-protein phosphatase 7 long form homolog [Quercus suber]
MEPQIHDEPQILEPGPSIGSLLTRQRHHRSEDIRNGEDPGQLMCRGRTKEMANVQMHDNRVIDIIKLLRLEGLFRAPSREIDNCLITALVERWRPETHTFHLPHGEMSITLQDVEVIFGLPIDGEVLVGPTAVLHGTWSTVCMEFLGFTPANDNKTLVGQRILISRLVQAIAAPLPDDATEIQIHNYARCYILALLGDKLFMDKSGDRVHLMFLEQLQNLHDPPQYSWGSGCLAWLYRELCRASEKGASQIGGACTLVQYWAWARLPFLCPRIEPPPGCDYGPWPYAPLAFKWVRVPGSKSRPSGMALVHYREQLVTMKPDQIVWQPYEAHFVHLPDFCVAGRGTWTARVPLVCFCIVETHHPDRVLRQFGLAQERPDHVVYDDRLHRIDLRGKVEKNWRQEHEPYIISWNSRAQRVCRAPPQTGEMARDHDYYKWYGPVTRKYIDRNSARLHQLIESHLALLNWLPVGSQEHNHVRRILYNVAGLDAPSTSAALVTTPTRGRRDTGSLSTSAARGRGRLVTASPSTSTARARGRPITASPSPIAARGRGRPATTSPSTSVARGRGRCATTPRVVSSLEIPAPIPHASPQPEVPPPIPIASPQSEVPPPMVDISPQPEVPSPTPPSQPSPFTPPMHPETPLYPPTSSTALTVPMDPPSIEPMTMIPTPGLYIEHHYPPTSSSSDLLGPPVGIDPLQPDIDVPDEHPPHQPSPPRGRPQRARRAPTCGTGGHKIGHKGNSMGTRCTVATDILLLLEG